MTQKPLTSKGNHIEDDPEPSWGIPSNPSMQPTPKGPQPNQPFPNQMNNTSMVPTESQRNSKHKPANSMEWKIQDEQSGMEPPSEEKKLIGTDPGSNNLIEMGLTGRNDTNSNVGPPANNSKGFQYVKFENSKGFNDYNPGYPVPTNNGTLREKDEFGNSKGFQIGRLQDSKGFGFQDGGPSEIRGTPGDGGSQERVDTNNVKKAEHKSFSTMGKSVLNSSQVAENPKV